MKNSNTFERGMNFSSETEHKVQDRGRIEKPFGKLHDFFYCR